MAGIIIKPRARLLHGHDWVYSSDVMKSWGDIVDGGVITLKDGRDRMLGSAIYNSKSQIVARRFSRQRQDLDLDFFQRRFKQALAYRERRGIDPQLCRLVWSESDGLPGLIVDRYGATLVVQTLTLAMDQRLGLIVEALLATFAPEAIIERNDAPIRKAEGLELRTGILHGIPSPADVEILGLRFELDLLHGQKTGFYLDQIGNYQAIARWAAGKRVLDCFANQGAFALACAKAGATSVTAVEISAECCALLRGNAERNQLAIDTREENVFDFLKAAEQSGATYDLVILDPPSFTKSKSKLNDAMRGYKEIHLRALKLLTPEGLLATFSCSHHVSAELFREMLVEAMVDAKKSARLLESYSQAADHPVLATVPETEYLKGWLFELAPGR